MDPKSPLGLGHPTPSFTDLRDDARTIDDASRSSEETGDSFHVAERRNVLNGIALPTSSQLEPTHSAHPTEHRGYSCETFNRPSTFDAVNNISNAMSTTSTDCTNGRPTKIRRLSGTTKSSNMKDANFIETPNITRPSNTSPQLCHSTICTSCKKPRHSSGHRHRFPVVPSPINGPSKPGDTVQNLQDSNTARPKLVALTPKPTPNISMPFPSTHSVATPSQGVPNASPIPGIASSMKNSGAGHGNSLSTAAPIARVASNINTSATVNSNRCSSAPPISRGSMASTTDQSFVFNDNRSSTATPIPHMASNMAPSATVNTIPPLPPIIPSMATNGSQHATVNPILPAPPIPSLSMANNITQAATPWPRCRGRTRQNVHRPCSHSPAELAWKRTATQCMDCLANAPKGNKRINVEARVAAGHNPCSKCFVEDARPDGGLCEDCLAMGRNNLALRNAGIGKRKHANAH
ncbi:hypothetical protein GE21DRAFT_5028 [Neurospora crassa]|uniref:Uncharacterized protein n=1 Tax=Neurospora crassa (strain ATCC 24698 / 74-OR23-1A / CBS 708.71 / DSM 1257 / FGSC 987) TaxID=367110 RepID=Q7S3J8_NEUCR|nr:hypothetical protein NCU08245 [Neurospora crassa OR74A]EAA30099.1 hypothetical protein NCU08245 [Neurospora crassa OR74A]KHE86502.1 hypothetical protein GE21DRAFT_5028 [Neurospora crassa]|eukprot:XP_959335.1 hypothetical protein NCU08245 [Neurospora crassa OR74A]